jgi:hypothetical protein
VRAARADSGSLASLQPKTTGLVPVLVFANIYLAGYTPRAVRQLGAPVA